MQATPSFMTAGRRSVNLLREKEMEFSAIGRIAVLSVPLLAVGTGCHAISGKRSCDATESYAQCETTCESLECDAKSQLPWKRAKFVNEEEPNPKKKSADAKRDSKINADGCQPDKERKPLIKRIGDKANLESDNEAIKTAAKIKREEDLAAQKIKAIKYLGMMGCCCYDKDGSVEKALLDALDDCTPVVRMTTVQVLGGCICGKEQSRTCCTEKIVAKLADLAWGVDDKGQYKEPSEEIRQWAAYVAQTCCPGGVYPTMPEESKPVETPLPIEGAPKSNSVPSPTPVPGTDQASLVNPKIDQRAARPADALVANLLSPDEALRLETIRVVEQAVLDGWEFADDEPDANGDTVVLTLRRLAYGFHRSGEWIERSDAVRTAAATALPHVAPEQIVLNRPFVIALPGAEVPSSEAVGAIPVAQVATVVAEPRVIPEAAAVEAMAPAAPAVVAPPQAIAQPVAPANLPDVAAPSAAPAVTSAGQPVSGQVEVVDTVSGTAMIRLPNGAQPRSGSRVLVYHRYVLGRVKAVGEFEVTDSAPGLTTIRSVAGTSMLKIATGDSATVYVQ